AVHVDASAWGHGRASTTAEAEPVAILEVYERLAGFPISAPLVTDRPYSEIAADALDPTTLGGHTPEQLAHPTARVRPFTRDTPMDWVWGHDADTDEPTLVPAELGFYQYNPQFGRDRLTARAARESGQAPAKKFFDDCSSGCALGANYEEAALYSLLELAERDAFLLSWHRAQPLPRIILDSLPDEETRRLLALIAARGFDVQVLRATQDIDLPIVWALAINRTGGFPASFSSAGSSADPQAAVRGALREIAQLVTDRRDEDLSDIEPMLADPWNIQELVQHPRFYMHPATLPRVQQVLGGPECTLEESFPDWPQRLVRASGQDVRGAFTAVRGLFAEAGLNRVILVDQSTVEHRDLGLSVVKAVVPGIVPMCFGLAQQRLAGQWRLAAALRGTPQEAREIPYDPHPFP
ncbi:MAG: YcaO-like family protein, partial [Angustibacter sp.]